MHAGHSTSAQNDCERKMDSAAGQTLQAIYENPGARYALEAAQLGASPAIFARR